MKKNVLFLLVSVFSITVISAQTKYEAVDKTVQKLGALPTLNVARIADTVSISFTDKEEKARAIFYWIANNIAIDPKAVKQGDNKLTLPEKVTELRRSTPLGFSLLFQEMCSHVNIRCLSVDGYVRHSSAEINEPADEINHSWNVVQLGQSPETWFYVDAYNAAGALDKKMTLFSKAFTGEYFFADRQLFNIVYFPDNSAWQLGGGPKSKKEFFAMPFIGNEAFPLELRKPLPVTGFIKTKIGTPVVFSFSATGTNRPKNISLLIGDEKKQPKPEPVNFDDSGSSIKFSYAFKKEDTYPVKVVADGKTVLEYIVEVNE
jgi:hypothetical protein